MDQGALDLDQRVRLAAFAFLAEQTQLHGEVLPRTILATGFTFDGSHVALFSPQQGIFKPAILPEMPFSVSTVPVNKGQPHPYADEIGDDGSMGSAAVEGLIRLTWTLLACGSGGSTGCH